MLTILLLPSFAAQAISLRFASGFAVLTFSSAPIACYVGTQDVVEASDARVHVFAALALSASANDVFNLRSDHSKDYSATLTSYHGRYHARKTRPPLQSCSKRQHWGLTPPQVLQWNKKLEFGDLLSAMSETHIAWRRVAKRTLLRRRRNRTSSPVN